MADGLSVIGGLLLVGFGISRLKTRREAGKDLLKLFWYLVVAGPHIKVCEVRHLAAHGSTRVAAFIRTLRIYDGSRLREWRAPRETETGHGPETPP
jgi:hypothetical protein